MQQKLQGAYGTLTNQLSKVSMRRVWNCRTLLRHNCMPTSYQVAL